MPRGFVASTAVESSLHAIFFFFLALVSLFHACRQCLPATCPKLLLSSWIGINSAGLLTNMEAESKSVALKKMWLSDFQSPCGGGTWILPLPTPPKGHILCGVWCQNYPHEVITRGPTPEACSHSQLSSPPTSFQETRQMYPGRGPCVTGALFSVLIRHT